MVLTLAYLFQPSLNPHHISSSRKPYRLTLTAMSWTKGGIARTLLLVCSLTSSWRFAFLPKVLLLVNGSSPCDCLNNLDVFDLILVYGVRVVCEDHEVS